MHSSIQNIMKRFGGSSKKKSSKTKKKGAKKKATKKTSMWNVRSFRHATKLLSTKEKVAVGTALGALVLSFSRIIIYGWNYGLEQVPKVGGPYTEGLVGQPVHINPLYASTNEVDRTLVKLLFAGLVRFDTRQEFVPDLAENWDVSDDGKEYTFFLRRDVVWPDGTPFTAHDVRYTIESIQDPEYLSPLRAEWQGIEIEMLDEYTIRFVLGEPYAPFLSNATVGVIPAHLWEAVLPLNAPLAELNLKPVGLGAWQFDSLSKDRQGNIRSYSVTRNENYHGSPAWLEEIDFKFYANPIAAEAALTERNVEGLSFLTIEAKNDLEDERKEVTFHSLQLPQYTGLFFNTDQNDQLGSKAVRKALAHAIDRNDIVQRALYGEADIVDGPILPGYPGYNPLIQKYDYDPLGAAEMLEDAGWKIDPETKTRFKGEEQLSVVLTTVNQSDYVSAAAIIEENWTALGVSVQTLVTEGARIQRDIIRPREYQALLFGEIVGIDPDPYPFWHSTQANESGLNLANFSSSRADTLLEEARQITDPVERAEQYIAFQDIIAEEVPAIFLYTPHMIYPVSSKIQGVDIVRIGEPADRLSTVNDWYIKTKKSLKPRQ